MLWCTYPRQRRDMVIRHHIFSIFSHFSWFFSWSLLGLGPFWLVPFGRSLMGWSLLTSNKCIFSQITLKFLILSASAHTGFDHQSAKIPAKTCSMFPGHAHRTVLQDQKEYCNFKNFKQNILFRRECSQRLLEFEFFMFRNIFE